MARYLVLVITLLASTRWGVFTSKILADDAATGRRPNFVLFLMDDVGYADVGCFGATGFKTPQLDRMAREGVKFTDFYVHPVCGVTRAALMTGCYAMRVGEVGNRKFPHPILHSDEVTIAEVLKTAGYATALIGKWHLAGPDLPKSRDPLLRLHDDLLPNGQGFDYWFGTPTHNGTSRTIEGSPFRTRLMRQGRAVDDSVDQSEMDELTRRYTEEAVAWIRRHRDEPFFLFLSHSMAHVVLGASERFRGSSQRGLYGDVMQELDWSAGRIVATLKELGLERNTLVVFTSDNGPWDWKPLAGKTPWDDHYGRATPLRGYKMTTWEGGVRVPTIVRWPGHAPAGDVCRQPATIMDLLPTFAKLAGARLPQDRIIDGRDIEPLVTRPTTSASPHAAIYYYDLTHLQAVRSGSWKLVCPRPAKPPWCAWAADMIDAVPDWELYNLDDDMGEKHNVASEHPEIVSRLKRLFDGGRRELGDYDRIGVGQRFFEPGARRAEASRWVTPKN